MYNVFTAAAEQLSRGHHCSFTFHIYNILRCSKLSAETICDNKCVIPGSGKCYSWIVNPSAGVNWYLLF